MKTTSIILLVTGSILFSPLCSIWSQNSDHEKYFTAKIVDETTKEPVSFVHVFNESTRKYSISDIDGNLKMHIKNNDTLVISCIGYLGKVIYVDENKIEEPKVILLSIRNYAIDEVKIIGFRSYSDFKYKLEHLDLPKTETELLKEKLKYTAQVEGRKAGEQKKIEDKIKSGEFGFKSTAPILSNDDIQRIKLAEIKKEENKRDIIYKKYNPEIVSKITGLKGNDLFRFIQFCNFSEEFLLETNQYDIMVLVLEKLKLYLKAKEESLVRLNVEYA